MVALADLVSHPGLRLRPLVDQRRSDAVRWVATSEIANPAPFLEGGEVLLTTGLETAHWHHEWDAYAERLAGAGVVAIGLGLGFTHAAAPGTLAAACRRHGLDLFEVPRETRFVSISRFIADELQREAQAATRHELVSQRALTQAALEDQPEVALVAAVARAASMAALAGPDGRLRIGPAGRRPDLLDAEEVAAAIAHMRPQGLRAASNLAVGGNSVLVQPVGVRGRPTGYLVAGFLGRVTEGQRSTLTTAIALLSLTQERLRVGRESEMQLRARALELLVSGDPGSAQVLLSASGRSRRRLPDPTVILRAIGDRAAMDEGAELGDSVGLAAVLGTEAGSAELVLVAPQARAEVVARSLVEVGLRVGLGEPGPPDAAPRSFRTAGHALAQTVTGSPIVSWLEGVRRGVFSILDRERAAAFSTTFLAPLENEGTDLIVVLSSYLRHNGAVSQVAAELGLHRNTVRHRLHRVEQLLERSLDEPQLRLDAWVALQMRTTS